MTTYTQYCERCSREIGTVSYQVDGLTLCTSCYAKLSLPCPNSFASFIGSKIFLNGDLAAIAISPHMAQIIVEKINGNG